MSKTIDMPGIEDVTVTGDDAFIDRLADALADKHPLSKFVSGPFLKAIVKHFCAKVSKNYEGAPVHSLGRGANGLAATDTHSAIIVGPACEHYDVTDRREILLEAERATLWNEGAQFDTLQLDPNGFPGVGKVFERADAVKRPVVIRVHPELLARVGQIALAAGANTVTLKIAPRDARFCEFEFACCPTDQLELFEDSPASVPCRGLLALKGLDPEREGAEE